MVHSTESGEPDAQGMADLVNVAATTVANMVIPAGPPIEMIFGGEIMYAKAGVGEKIEFPNSDRPSPNTEAFIERLERRIYAALGWPYELLDPTVRNGGAIRLVQDLARQYITNRQTTLERRAKAAITFSLGYAMENGLLARNADSDWAKWSFTRPAKITVDNGNEASARDGLKLGINTLSEIAAKKGSDWIQLRNQTQKETEDLLDRAMILSKKYNITVDKALGLMSQRYNIPLADNSSEAAPVPSSNGDEANNNPISNN